MKKLDAYGPGRAAGRGKATAETEHPTIAGALRPKARPAKIFGTDGPPVLSVWPEATTAAPEPEPRPTREKTYEVIVVIAAPYGAYTVDSLATRIGDMLQDWSVPEENLTIQGVRAREISQHART